MAQLARELTVAPLSGIPIAPVLPRLRVLLWLAALVTVVGLIAASSLFSTASRATTGYSIQRLRAERDEWQMRNDQLRVELAKLQSLTYVEHEAVTRLKMEKPARLIYLTVDPTAIEQASRIDSRAASVR